MFESAIALTIPFAVMLLVIGMTELANTYRQRLIRKRNRRTPLTKSMLRAPGDTLRKEIDELAVDQGAFLALVFAMPFILLSFTLLQILVLDLQKTTWYWGAFITCTMTVTAWLLRRIYAIKEKIRRKTLGMEGEIATGEELNQLMLVGCRVFHDIPFEYGNIDHIVVGRSGVFSVETKALSKTNESGSHKATVDFTKNIVRFSNWNWLIPLDQLKTNSRWLSQHLTKSTGMHVSVNSMLALPGYYIEKRIGKGDVLVFNPTRSETFFVNSRVVFTPEQVQRIAHQIEQLCRNVEPSFQHNRQPSQAKPAR